MPENKFILVTGQSGIKVRDCIEKLGYTYASIEETICKENKISFLDFIGSHQFLQYENWTKAFNKILDEKSLSDSCFLTFHSVYYHQRKRELFSPVNLSLLAERLKDKVKMIIVLIDDIYDVYRRLMAPNQMFEEILNEKKTTPIDAIYSSIFNIVSLLNWREMEISISRSIANLLNTRMFIVSTKHPVFLIKRLVENSLESQRIYYLSHPITSVRYIAETTLASFVGKLESFLEKVLDLPNVVVFFPTSIDELIIAQENSDTKGKFFVPHLAQRWSIPYQDSIISPPLPDTLKKINPLNPQNYEVVPKIDNATTHAISRLLSLLWEIIYKKQIISRDYSLVEQCKDGIIVCRPYFLGEKASGVRGELLYNFLLMEKQADREAFVFSCKQDMNKFFIKKLFSMLKTLLAEVPSNFGQKKSKWLQEVCNIQEMSLSEIQKKLVKDVLPGDYDFDISGPSGAWGGDSIASKSDRRKIGFNEVFKNLKIDEIQLEIDSLDLGNKITYHIYDDEKKIFDEAVNFMKNRIKQEGDE